MSGVLSEEIRAVTLSYKVYGDAFLPLDLVQNAGIVAKDVHASKGFCNFLKSILKTNYQKIKPGSVIQDKR